MSGSGRSAFAQYAGPPKKPVIDASLLKELADVSALENQACARKVALAAEIWDSCIHQNVQVGDHIMDAGNYAASETAKALVCSKTIADGLAEVGMDLRLRLPAVRDAFEAGELDFTRVRAIYRTTASLSLEAAERVETEALHAARRLSPGPLATEVCAIVQRTAPDEVVEVRKDLARLHGVRYRDKDMIATIEANLEAADAAACWQLINEMAATLCPRDPRTRGQRRAAAYTALMHGETYIACTCEVDEDHPCTAKRDLPDRREPLTNVTIDLETLVGLADLPGYLAGHGLIDAEYARELASSGDLQLILTEAVNLAEKLGVFAQPSSASTGQDSAREDDATDSSVADSTDADGSENAPEGNSERPNDPGSSNDPASSNDSDSSNVPESSDAGGTTSEGAGGTRRGVGHLAFHPLGRGRRRRGLTLPKPSTPLGGARAGSTTGTGEYRGSFTLTAALEKAIAENPALAVALYPDGHGGFIEPPDDALRYRPGISLAECVRQRDRTCRHPGCDVPAASCEIDHVIPFDHRDPARGGWTVLTNLHCLCRYHHSLKTMGVWMPTMLAGAVDYWRSSSGTTAVTLPGSTVGTTDFAEGPLIPHVPCKRRPKCSPELQAAAATGTAVQDAGANDEGATGNPTNAGAEAWTGAGADTTAGAGAGTEAGTGADCEAAASGKHDGAAGDAAASGKHDGAAGDAADSGKHDSTAGDATASGKHDGAAGDAAADTAKRSRSRYRSNPTSTSTASAPADSSTDTEQAGAKEGRTTRPRIRFDPVVECSPTMGMSIGLAVGIGITRHRGGAPF